ncbi:MAG: methionyl-tRNA formyltransferase-like protein [Chloroflexi bacterium]|uniref:methionyl-tRNA formyltransferase n=1 Tax=Candidatus Flexifilum breve TaxID=3140694 RepID=UPI00313643DC|nr:methionyl-tRNA formyltransferase-like protein [Chloroflexota bacterium]MBK9747949.1 methionyl-tRNA formyltransferase-like protein [Chloroflexota bacterium]
MRIALLCATRRGFRVLEQLIRQQPEAELIVFSFREEAHEPPFLDDIQQLAEAHGAAFYEARQVGAPKWADFWANTPIDLMLTVSWRYLIPREVYERVRLGTYVLHDSLLPAYRGFAPTVWAIINGEDHTGVTLFEIAEGVDSGRIIAQQRVPIGPDDTIADVMEAVTQSYLAVLAAQLPALLDGTAGRTEQDESRATYTCKRIPEDNRIDWTQPTAVIYNLIRAVSAPYPGAFTTLNGHRLYIWAAQRVAVPPYVGRVIGRVIEIRRGEGVVVLTSDGALLIQRVSWEGEPPVAAEQILNNLSHTLGR